MARSLIPAEARPPSLTFPTLPSTANRTASALPARAVSTLPRGEALQRLRNIHRSLRRSVHRGVHRNVCQTTTATSAGAPFLPGPEVLLCQPAPDARCKGFDTGTATDTVSTPAGAPCLPDRQATPDRPPFRATWHAYSPVWRPLALASVAHTLHRRLGRYPLRKMRPRLTARHRGGPSARQWHATPSDDRRAPALTEPGSRLPSSAPGAAARCGPASRNRPRPAVPPA